MSVATGMLAAAAGWRVWIEISGECGDRIIPVVCISVRRVFTTDADHNDQDCQSRDAPVNNGRSESVSRNSWMQKKNGLLTTKVTL